MSNEGRHRLSYIIATLGPSTDNEKELITMLMAGIARQWIEGVDIARVLYSDGKDVAKDRIEIFWAKDKKNWDLGKINDLFKNKQVYITFDVDSFDSSIMPATGTPEPGGLFWDEVLSIIKMICKVSNIVGADINELAPIKKFDSYNFLVAKLAYKIIAYSFEFKR